MNPPCQTLALPLTPRDLQRLKLQRHPITALTVWDALSGRLVDQAGVDVALVGDSLAMVSLGHASTLPVTLEEMLHHARAAGRAIQRALMVCDLPFLSYQCGPDAAVAAAGRVLKDTPCAAVKLEGGEPEVVAVVDRLVRMGIPVVGHLGLTPQSVHRLGYRQQAADAHGQERLRRQSLELQTAGCSALVLEHVPAPLASRLSRELLLPVIGIGAGDGCDGQVLVTADLLGLTERQPPFAPARLDGAGLALQTLRGWCEAVRAAGATQADSGIPQNQPGDGLLQGNGATPSSQARPDRST